MMHSKRKSMLAGSIVLVAITGLHIAAITSTPASAQIRLNPTGNPIPPKFFGMHIHRAATTTPWPPTPFGSWRLWDAGVAWPALEPEKDKWNFANADKYVSMADEHHVGILLTLGLTPSWASARPEEKSGYSPGNAAEPKNMSDWQNFVRTVAIRYKGRIHEYEIWNEPNLKDFYTGSVPELVEMARIACTTLKEIDPTNLVISPSFTDMRGVSWLDQYLQAGGGKYADVIGYHFYVISAPPEELVPLLQQVEAVMSKHGVRNKQLWDTELGWSAPKPFPSEELAASYVARAYVLHWAMGVSRFYWYSWDNQKYSLQMTQQDDKTLKPAAVAYSEVQKWLVGAKMLSCESNSDGTWVAELSRQGNYHGWVVWNPTRTVNFTPPSSWNVKNVRDLAGKTQPLPPARPSIAIGPSPVLLESQAP
jgi:hypothetical protein